MEGFFSLQHLQEILSGVRQKLWAGGFSPAILYQMAVVGMVVLVMVLMGGLARLLGFGDSSINLDLRVWVKDPEQGVTKLRVTCN
jgi:hypothetical protein